MSEYTKEFILLASQGVSQKEIGTRYSLPQTKISRLLKKAGFIYKKDIYICKECNKNKIEKDRLYCSKYCESKHRDNMLVGEITEGKISNRRTLRRILLKLNGHICSTCSNTEWMGVPITLELEHINGNPYDDKLKNLKMVCPNCHSQTPTYKSKNRGNGRTERMKRYREGKSY